MFRSAAVLGLIALACVGCASSGTQTFASNPNYRTDAPMDPSWSWRDTQNAQECQGWYDTVARVCDSLGSGQ